ncbi:MAG: NADP-reducing hydrogenase subunit HndC [Fimbriimonadaceae bacterium]|nr:NADP-reducing hydrogenase subunit HndC [Fimbriimonadaceae bacterium]
MKTVQPGPEIESFYHLSGVEMENRRCRGLGCFAAKAQDPSGWRTALAQWPPVYCLGKCYASPSSTETIGDPRIEIHCDEPIVLAGVSDGSQQDYAAYRAAGGYTALERVIRSAPEWAIEQLELSQLRGRGGAAFPAARKWRAVHGQDESRKFVVANADEGDHGSYIDRFIIERTPHRLIESLLIAGHAVGADKGYIYLRKEYPVAEEKLRAALKEATAEGWLGGNFELELVIGQGSYVCGEETSLLNSIEHRRPEVRSRPPYPTQAGLFGAPTLVNNVETLASIPWIMLNGGEAYAKKGIGQSRGTKAVSLNSLFKRPGLYEVEFGVPLRTILKDIGGGLKASTIKAVMVGGPLAGVVRPEEFDVAFGFEEMQAIGASIGHGGIVAFDDLTRMPDLLAHIFSFGAVESCGKCVPCRIGTGRAQALFDRIAQEGELSVAEAVELKSLLQALRLSSLCGHGTGLAEVAASILAKFPEEFPSCLR